MKQLIWKEWHEQSWKLGFGCLVLAAVALIGLRARLIADDTLILWICTLGMTLLPVLSSTGLVPAERSSGSLEALMALPVSRRKILAVKTVVGLLQCGAPLLLAAVVSIIVAGNREVTSAAMLHVYLRSVLASLSLFMWMFALTIYLPTEARATMLAVGVLICWTIATAGLTEPGSPLLLQSISPLCFVFDRIADARGAAFPPLIVPILVQTPILLLLWAWSVRRLGVDLQRAGE